MRTNPAPRPQMTCGFLIQLVFCKKKKKWFIGVEVEQETSALPPKKNPGSAPEPLCKYPVCPIVHTFNQFVPFVPLFSVLLLRYMCNSPRLHV